ncbi:Hypothetical predicted protein, partial [Paramuricea clavata]
MKSMKSMKIAVFLVLIIAQQSYCRTRCSGEYHTCASKSPIACDYASQKCYVNCFACRTGNRCCTGCELCSP